MVTKPLKDHANWTMFMYDISYRGRVNDKGLYPPLDLIWKFRTGGPVRSSPIVVDDVVYVGSDDNKLYALNASKWGMKWSFDAGDKISFSPSYYDGKVYFTTRSNKVYSLDATTGEKRWEFQCNGWINAPVVIFNGRVYFGSYSDNIFILDANTGRKVGQAKGRITINNVNYSCVRGEFYPVDSVSRTAEWRNMFPTSESWPVTVNDIVYIGGRDNKLHAFDVKTRRIIWEFETEGWVDSTPAVWKGKLYFGSHDGYVYALGRAGGREKRQTVEHGKNGIVVQNAAPVYLSPKAQSNTEKVYLNEGVELSLIDKIPGWMKVGLPDGSIGWMKGSDFIQTRSFKDLLLNDELVKRVEPLKLRSSISVLSWSRDGSRLAFFDNVSTRNLYWMAQSIWVASADGSNPTWISDGNFYNPHISWSHDNKFLAFENLNQTERQIWIAKFDGLGLKKVTIGESPSFSPSDNRLSFIRRESDRSSLWTYDISNRKAKKITEFHMKGESSYIAYGYTASICPPAWSGDGGLIAVALDGYYYKDNNSRVVVVSSNGGLFKEIAIRAWRIKSISWSPRGKLIAFVTEEHSSRQLDQTLDRKVHIINLDNQNVWEFDHSDSISWSPNGRYLSFIEFDSRMGRSYKVWLFDVSKKSLVRVLSSNTKVEKTYWLDKDSLVLSMRNKPGKTSESIQYWMIDIGS